MSKRGSQTGSNNQNPEDVEGVENSLDPVSPDGLVSVDLDEEEKSVDEKLVVEQQVSRKKINVVLDNLIKSWKDSQKGTDQPSELSDEKTLSEDQDSSLGSPLLKKPAIEKEVPNKAAIVAFVIKFFNIVEIVQEKEIIYQFKVKRPIRKKLGIPRVIINPHAVFNLLVLFQFDGRFYARGLPIPKEKTWTAGFLEFFADLLFLPENCLPAKTGQAQRYDRMSRKTYYPYLLSYGLESLCSLMIAIWTQKPDFELNSPTGWGMVILLIVGPVAASIQNSTYYGGQIKPIENPEIVYEEMKSKQDELSDEIKRTFVEDKGKSKGKGKSEGKSKDKGKSEGKSEGKDIALKSVVPEEKKGCWTKLNNFLTTKSEVDQSGASDHKGILTPEPLSVPQALAIEFLLEAKRSQGFLYFRSPRWTEFRPFVGLGNKIILGVAAMMVKFGNNEPLPLDSSSQVLFFIGVIAFGGFGGLFEGADASWGQFLVGQHRLEIADYLETNQLTPMAPEKEASWLAYLADNEFLARTLSNFGPFILYFSRISLMQVLPEFLGIELGPYAGVYYALILWSGWEFARTFHLFNVLENMHHLPTPRELENIVETKAARILTSLVLSGGFGYSLYSVASRALATTDDELAHAVVYGLIGTLTLVSFYPLYFRNWVGTNPNANRLTRYLTAFLTFKTPIPSYRTMATRILESKHRVIKQGLLALASVTLFGTSLLLTQVPSTSLAVGSSFFTTLLGQYSFSTLICSFRPDLAIYLNYTFTQGGAYGAAFVDVFLRFFYKIYEEMAFNDSDSPTQMLNPATISGRGGLSDDGATWLTIGSFMLLGLGAAFSDLRAALPFVLAKDQKEQETRVEQFVVLDGCADAKERVKARYSREKPDAVVEVESRGCFARMSLWFTGNKEERESVIKAERPAEGSSSGFRKLQEFEAKEKEGSRTAQQKQIFRGDPESVLPDPRTSDENKRSSSCCRMS